MNPKFRVSYGYSFATIHSGTGLDLRELANDLAGNGIIDGSGIDTTEVISSQSIRLIRKSSCVAVTVWNRSITLSGRCHCYGSLVGRASSGVSIVPGDTTEEEDIKLVLSAFKMLDRHFRDYAIDELIKLLAEIGPVKVLA